MIDGECFSFALASSWDFDHGGTAEDEIDRVIRTYQNSS